MSNMQKRTAESLQPEKASKMSKISDDQVIDSELLSHDSKASKIKDENAKDDASKKPETTTPQDSGSADDLRTKKTSMDYQTMLAKQAEKEKDTEKAAAAAAAAASSITASFSSADTGAAESSASSTASTTEPANTKIKGKKESSLESVPAKVSKPILSPDDSQRQRKESHKVVEKKRRDNINRGISQLAALLPSAENNKAQILQRAVELIKRLQENANNNMEKWTFEKLLTDQAIAELSASNEKLKEELERTYRELEFLKKRFNEKGSEK